jgi:hypothetical protein
MSSSVQQAPGITRTDLQRHDLTAPGREVIQNPIDAILEVGGAR